MKKHLHPKFVIVLLFFLPQLCFATHIVGGEMNYRCLGNDEYEIQLTIFRDCETGIPDFDDPASVGIFAYDVVTNTYSLATGVGEFGQLRIPVTNDDTLDPVLTNPCLVVPPEVCVNTSTYTDTVSLPFRAGGYTLAYQRCCRNASILNIITPLDVGATYTAIITEKSLQECNSNAVFNEWPPIYICVNEPIDFDHAATDIDGDSLVYRLCVPYLGADPDMPMPQPPSLPPYQNVTWVSPTYSLTNMMGGVPLTIDSESGFLTGIPDAIGQYVVGVCVDEYRDDEVISTTRRDFQYNVGVCGNFAAAVFVPEVSCEGLDVTFDNLSENSQSYSYFFNDPNNPGASSSEFEPTYSYSDTGTYTVELAVQVALNGSICADTAETTFSIYEHSLIPEFEVEILSCDTPYTLGFSNSSVDTVFDLTNWEWSVNNIPFSNNELPPNFISNNSNNNTFTVELVLTNNKGCMDSLTQIVDLNIDLDYQNIQRTCEFTSSTTLSVVNSGASTISEWSWSPAAAILSGGSTGTPTVDLSADSVFYFSVTYGEDCIFEDSILVINEGVDLMLAGTAIPDTIYKGESSQLNVMGNNLFAFDWLPDNSLDDGTIASPVATPESTTEYTTIVTDANGCIDTLVLLVVVLSTVCEEPFLFMPNAFTPNQDNENDVLYVEGNTIDVMHLVIYDRWGEKVFESRDQSFGWDGTFKNELLEPDVYGYYLTVDCINGERFVKKGNVSLIR